MTLTPPQLGQIEHAANRVPTAARARFVWEVLHELGTPPVTTQQVADAVVAVLTRFVDDCEEMVAR